MADSLKLMLVVAHPDDESLGMGGTLARYAAEGVATSLITATRGQRGWFGAPDENPGPEMLGQIRERELRDAARTLGVGELILLDYMDGDLDQTDPREIVPLIAGHIRRLRPQVVITFDPFGVYGHPDHIAISQFTLAALVAAAAPGDGGDPHQVAKLYFAGEPKAKLDVYERAFGELVMTIDAQERRAIGWPEWALTARLDTRATWRQVWDAIRCHRTQLPGYDALLELPDETQIYLWGEQTLYRAHSLVNGGRQEEHDLFEGLR